MYTFLFERGLQLVELLEVRSSSLYRGRHGSVSSRMTLGGHVWRGSHVPPLRGSCASLGVQGCSVNLEVEALS